LGGVLKDIPISLKVDGLGFRIGKNKDGKVFVEGSRTGPIFEPKAFSTYTKARGAKDEIVIRAQHYDDMFDIFKSADFLTAIPNDVKLICEIFYNPMATEDDTGITFVTVKYDKTKLGSLMTIFPISFVVASTGEQLPKDQQESIKKNLFKFSNDKIKFADVSMKIGSLDINATIDPLVNFDDSHIEILKSRKAADKIQKENLLAIINKVKEDLATLILNADIDGKDKFGKEIEGIVLAINGKSLKVTTKEFKDSKRKV
jgi:hypothetical protein